MALHVFPLETLGLNPQFHITPDFEESGFFAVKSKYINV